MPKYIKGVTPKKFKENKHPEGVLKYAQPGEIFVEITKDMVPGVYDYYQISNFGRLYHNYRQVMLKPYINKNGYVYINLTTENGYKSFRLHRVVMIAFKDIPDRDSYQVNHINGDKTCNYLWNLEWNTAKENVQHAFRTGLQYIGEDKADSIITEKTAIEICEYLQQNEYTNQEIADICNTTQSIVNHIKNRECWTHISCNYEFTKTREWRLFTPEQVSNLCKYFQIYYRGSLTSTQHARNALIYYGYSIEDRYVDTARDIYNRKKYTKISQNYNKSIVQRLSHGGEIPQQE